ncbi:hypothetical protein GGTG_12708 [Gaeumannomyces tritici R3-111a-1]|uniref:Deoxyribonuclease NucA/NucB domain-containing protein n=1 Tax=Gaeumannomyces tritici (strain R3-111a-1) TaxID=644352 RepID=J3PGS8_GAET3|nr:hypothetical protein GGTG_12708 [Gaeumannomyces tritici R3-111a-1]EJT69825.1 hypothetical protein GGTG_12708 [Gaeumannomyces tritici R3-111a-1]
MKIRRDSLVGAAGPFDQNQQPPRLRDIRLECVSKADQDQDTACPLPDQEASPQPTQPQVLTFDCSHVGETYNTMCYDIKCHKLPSKLTWENPSDPARDGRRTLAGCGSMKDPANPPGKPKYNNRCARASFANGYNCDECPFASAASAGRGGQINRCVPKGDNSKQGAKLGDLYHGKNEKPYKYCTGDCKPDGNTFQKYDDLSRRKTKRSLAGEVVRCNDTASEDDIALGTRSLTAEDNAASDRIRLIEGLQFHRG